MTRARRPRRMGGSKGLADAADAGPGARLRARYGGSPLHLLLVLCSFVLTGYAGIRLLDGDPLGVAVWFVGAAIAHDLVLVPLYSAADRALQGLAGRAGRRRKRGGDAADRRERSGREGSSGKSGGREGNSGKAGNREWSDRTWRDRGWINYVRVPAFLSLLLLLVWYPLITGRVGHYGSYTGLDADVFAGRWLLLTAAFFAVSALCLAGGVLRSGLRRSGGRRPGFRRARR